MLETLLHSDLNNRFSRAVVACENRASVYECSPHPGGKEETEATTSRSTQVEFGLMAAHSLHLSPCMTRVIATEFGWQMSLSAGLKLLVGAWRALATPQKAVFQQPVVLLNPQAEPQT